MVSDAEWLPVIAALTATGEARRTAVLALRTPEQLHQFALNYNPNDDPLVCALAAEHAACDRGTALVLLWLFSDLILYPGQGESHGSANEAVARIRQRLSHGSFAHQRWAFEAEDVLDLNVLQKRYLARVPEELLRCTGAPGPPRTWLP